MDLFTGAKGLESNRLEGNVHVIGATGPLNLQASKATNQSPVSPMPKRRARSGESEWSGSGALISVDSGFVFRQ